jgi:2-dehydropantoate 2-reductase
MERVAVVGVGAIGGLLAAELLAAGNDVTLCARSPLKRLVVEREDDPRDFAVETQTEPDGLSAHPYVVVALKGQESDAANPWLDKLADDDTVVVVVRNGVEHGEGIVPGIINTAVERKGPGHLVHRAGNLLTLGPGGEAFAPTLDGSALRVQIEPDFKTAAWRKLLSNLGANPLTAITERRADVFTEPAVREMVAKLLAEAVAIGRAEGAQLTDDDLANTFANYDSLPPDTGSSMLYDRLAGRPLEIEPLVGAVIRKAKEHGLEAPRAETLYALLKAI